jgi:hypothetical protein
MANTTASLTNINLLSKAQYDEQSTQAKDELWAVDIDTDSSFKEKVVHLGMPDYSAGVKITSNTNYTTPHNGFLIISIQSGAQSNYQVNINGQTVIRIGTWNDEADYRSITLPVAKDDIIRTDCSAATFYPCIGG